MQRAEEYGFPSVPSVERMGVGKEKVLCNPLCRYRIRPRKSAGEGTKMYLKLAFHTWPISYHTRLAMEYSRRHYIPSLSL